MPSITEPSNAFNASDGAADPTHAEGAHGTAASTAAGPSPHRRVRSFVVRAGRMGTGQTRALQHLAPRYVLPYADAAWDAAAAFGRAAPLVLEIGFGMGQATAAYAKEHPDINLLGVEVHPPGVGALLQSIDADRLGHLRIVQHDAVDVVNTMIAPQTLAGVHIFFPDPWPKKRHHKRRLIQPEFVALLVSRMQPGAYLHLATDWEPYAQQMLEVLSTQPLLENTAEGFAPRPASRPVTKFERRGLALGHGVRDLLFRRR